MTNAATVNKSAQSMANDAGGTFADIVNQKAAEEEIGGHFATGGLWITYEDGHVHAHITQIMVQRFLRWYNGEVDLVS